MTQTARRYIAYAPGAFATRRAKTAHGVIAYGRDAVVAVVDPSLAGRTVRDVLPHLYNDAPIVATLEAALAFHPTSLLLGTAPQGGALPPEWRADVLRAISARLEIVSGLHDFLNDDTQFVAAAQRSGAALWDVRRPPEVPLFSGAAWSAPQHVSLFVGSDCAVGKMTAALELNRAAVAAGRRSEFLATGQTGIMIAGKGIAVDRVISDFVSGATEQLVVTADPQSELLFVEGQGSVNHPAYAQVTMGLLYGSGADSLILCHAAAREEIETFGTPILALEELVGIYERLCDTVKPARVVGICLNTLGLDDAAARRAIGDAERETGLPADDVVRFGPQRLYERMAPRLQGKTQPLGSRASSAR
ncbi:MAG TPA: DUF1611 domain-containing protein [Candidatus Dormibacteraeota bacterium]|nr:DUF1611 domain-containing protein [Candidatus Dormibacteraeota bacterium]